MRCFAITLTLQKPLNTFVQQGTVYANLQPQSLGALRAHFALPHPQLLRARCHHVGQLLGRGRGSLDPGECFSRVSRNTSE